MEWRMRLPALCFCLSLTTTWSWLRGSQAEVFTSTSHLCNVLTAEQDVVRLLDVYIQEAEVKLHAMRRYVTELDHVGTVDGATLAETVVEDPLAAFQLTKRLAVDWAHVESLLQDHAGRELLQQVSHRRGELAMPQDQDLQGAALALLRLQDTYRLNASDLARGNVLGMSSSASLTARDCLYLGKHSFHTGQVQRAVDWYNQALTVAQDEANGTVTPDEILPFLNQALEAKQMADDDAHRVLETPPQSNTETYKLGPNTTYFDDEINYAALCRGERLVSPLVQSNLHCQLSTRQDPYFFLQPIKMEWCHFEPQIITFHDVISDTEIEFIKNFARPLLERSTVVSTDGSGREVSSVRTSQNTWLFDNLQDDGSRNKFDQIMRRVGWITGLNTIGESNAEALQVANYGIGGHYSPHHDYLYNDKSPEELLVADRPDIEHGDRIATFMFYLSDVARGGATVFPRIGAAVWPKKGSAAFWYNLLDDSRPDILTLHGACPVLHGSKWVGNKWIREVNQVFRRPCGLEPSKQINDYDVYMAKF